jgi:hypothetical protein
LLQHEWPLTLSHRVVLPVAIGRLDRFRYFHQDHLFEIVLAGHDLLLACRSLYREQGRFRSSGDKLLQLLQDNQTGLNVVEGCVSSLQGEKSRHRPTGAHSSNSPNGLQSDRWSG